LPDADASVLEVSCVPVTVSVKINEATLESLPQVFGLLLKGQMGKIRTKKGREMKVVFVGYDTANEHIIFVPTAEDETTGHGSFSLTDIERLEVENTIFEFFSAASTPKR